MRMEQRAEHVVLHVDDDGLGLAIAREIAHRHHGTLTASAPESGGSRFTLSMVAG